MRSVFVFALLASCAVAAQTSSRRHKHFSLRGQEANPQYDPITHSDTEQYVKGRKVNAGDDNTNNAQNKRQCGLVKCHPLPESTKSIPAAASGDNGCSHVRCQAELHKCSPFSLNKRANTKCSRNAAETSHAQSVVQNGSEGKDVFMKGAYVELGMHEDGYYGTHTSPPPGFVAFNHQRYGGLAVIADHHKDGWDKTKNRLNFQGDITMPGSPHESWVVGYRKNGYRVKQCVGRSYSYHWGCTNTFRCQITDKSAAESGVLKATSVCENGDVEVTQTASFGADQLFIRTEVQVRALVAGLTDVRYMRNTDPDQDVDAIYNRRRDEQFTAEKDGRWGWSSAYTTQNKIVAQYANGDGYSAVASSSNFGTDSYFALFSRDPRSYVRWGGFHNTDPYTTEFDRYATAYKAGAEMVADEAIDIMFKLGNINSNSAESFDFYYVMDKTLESKFMQKLKPACEETLTLNHWAFNGAYKSAMPEFYGSGISTWSLDSDFEPDECDGTTSHYSIRTRHHRAESKCTAATGGHYCGLGVHTGNMAQCECTSRATWRKSKAEPCDAKASEAEISHAQSTTQDSSYEGKDVFMKGAYLEVGMHEDGYYGTHSDPPPGYVSFQHRKYGGLSMLADHHKDGWDKTKNRLNFQGDIAMPGSPHESWVLGYYKNGQRKVESVGRAYWSGRHTFNCKITDESREAVGALKATSVCENGDVEVTQTASFGAGQLFLRTEVQVRALVAGLTDVRYMRNVDPDQDVQQLDAQHQERWRYTTKNTVIAQYQNGDGFSAVAASSAYGTDSYFALFSRDSRSYVRYGGFHNTDPYTTEFDRYATTYKAGQTTTRDQAIDVMFKLGSLANGDSASTDFYYVMDKTLESKLDDALHPMCLTQAIDVDKCNGLKDYEKKCNNNPAAWAVNVGIDKLGHDGCEVHVYTKDSTCEDYCTSQHRQCIGGQDNRHQSGDDGCVLDPAHDRQSQADNGCNQRWNDQVCICK